MKKFLKRVLAPVVVGAMLVGVAGPAVAADEPGPVTGVSDATASSIGIATGDTNFHVRAYPTGILGSLLDPVIGRLLDGLLNPVSALLNGIPSLLVRPLTNLLVPESHAEQPGPGALLQPERFNFAGGTSPATGDPVTCTDARDTCYAPSLLGIIPASGKLDLGLVGLGLGTVAGTVEPIGTPADWDLVSQSKVAGLDLDLLGINLLKLGAITSTATCSAVGEIETNATTSVASLGLLNGLVSVSVAEESGLLSVQIGDQTLVSADRLSLSLPGYASNPVDLTLNGKLLQLGVGLDLRLSELLHLLGPEAEDATEGLRGPALDFLFNGALSALLGADVHVKLTVDVKSEVEPNANDVNARGLHIGLGVDLGLEVNLLGLLGVGLQTSDELGNRTSQLLALDLAQASCSSTTTPGAEDSWIAPGLT